MPHLPAHLVSFLLTLFSPLIEHVKVLYGQFDPVLDAPPEISATNMDQLTAYRLQRVQTDQSKHHFFLYSFGIFVFNIFDNLYVLWINGFDFTRRMPELFYHKIYPEAFWSQSDLIMVSIMTCSLVVYYNLWRNNWLDDRYCMYFVGDGLGGHKLIVNNKVWNQENANKIYAFRQADRRLRKIGMFCSYFFFQPYFQYHLWAKPERGPRQILMAVYISILLCYTVFSVIMLFYHFFIASKYIMIKQRFLISRMDALVEKLRLSSERAKASLHSFYGEFHSINQHLAYQCSEIRGYNRFWSIYLTAQFGSNIFCLSYLAYCYIFVPATFDQKVYYIFFGTELCVLIFAIIYRCSVIDANNDLFYDRNMKIGILFQLHYNLSIRLKANIDTISTNRNFSRCIFRLKNSYRLDSTAFNAALFIITTFFFSITKRARRQQMDQFEKL